MEMLSNHDGDILEFKVNFRVSKKVRKGFMGWRTKESDCTVLDNVKGRIESGTMTALLGASGCGKSTLLAALSQRLRGKVSSEIRFNGEAIDRTEMTKISGFVPQDNVFLGGLTVREHLYFMIEFKLSKLSRYEKRYLIESSLVKFRLDGETNVMLLSGGERRKLSLASELLTKPKILFCDEITSGLDSFSAFAVMDTLREIAGFSNEKKLFQKPVKPSRIVLFSIHQPTSDIFQLFTNIILMNAGRIIFHGSVDDAKKLFNRLGMICPPRYNPAEFYINKISDPQVADNIVKEIGATKTESEENFANLNVESSTDEEVERRTEVSWIRQVILLSYRLVLNFVHSPRNYLIELFILIIFALIITVVYSGVSLDSSTAVQDIKGFLFILATEVLFTHVYAVFYLVYEVLPLLRKETGDRLYSLSAYYVSLVLMMIPRVFFETFVYTAIIYFSADIGRSFTTFINISISIALSGVCGMAYGFFLSGLFENFFIGSELSSIADLILMIGAGVYININSTVPFLKYISLFFYANETVSIHFWLTVDDIPCNPNPEHACFPNGVAVLENYSFGTNTLDIYKDYGYQLILTIFLYVLAFIGIRKNVRRTGFY